MNDREGIPRQLRILLLEDDPSDAELILCAVRRGGITHVARCVSARDEFLAALTEFRPDLVLSDHKLPGFNGTEALAIVREQDPELPFIIITGALGDELAVETIKRGATDYILKDRLSRLVPAILRAVRETEQRNQRQQAEELVKHQHRTLEVQNETLKKAARDLEAARRRYARLYDTAPVGYASLSEEGIIHELNATFARMLGRERAELIETPFTSYVVPADLNQFAEHLGKCTQRAGAVRTELALTVSSHDPIAVELFSVSVQEPEEQTPFYQTVITDITERQQAEQALRQSERKLRLISENTTDVIFAFDMNRRPLYANSAVEKLTGYNFGEIEDKGIINWIHSADQERMLRHWEELYMGKAYHDVEFRLVTKTGQVKWCSSTWGPILDEQGRQIGVQGREQDITARKELEREVLETSANVRRNIGHELHDGLGQYLAGIALKTKALEESLAADGAAQTRTAKQVVGLLNNAIGQTRSLAHGFDPVQVEADGLVAALEKLTAQSAELLGVHCDFACNQNRLDVNPQAGLALYRIAQEAMHNAVKHGRARRIAVELEVDAFDLCLRIRDDGNGFAPAATPNTGMGLRVMQYRASSIGGALKIRSAPKQGTLAECRVPRQSCQPHPGTPGA